MKRQLALLARALAPWPRRQAPLLEVNCGNGAFLQFLWQSGFDPQGSEFDPALREKAQAAKVPGLEIHAAADDDLPFDNESFDWVIVHLKTAENNALAAAVREGARVAKRGLMLTFWNSSSFPALCWRLFNRKRWAAASAPWHKVYEIMTALQAGRLAVLSTLTLPGCAWHDPWPGGGMSIIGIPLGAWCVIRLDMGDPTPATPLPLRLGPAMARARQAVMEYAHNPAEQVKK